jgi:hypothetical protein
VPREAIVKPTREAAIVLDIFRKFHVQAGRRLLVDAVLLHAPSADYAREGLAELVRSGLIVEHGEETELTPAGYDALWSFE